MGNLQGRVALVTGGIGGIGRAISERYASEGATVWVTDMLDEDDPVVTELMGRMGNSMRYMKLDVSSEGAWTAAERAVRDAGGGLDVLVLNAGIGYGAPVTETPASDWRQVMAVNTDGVFYGMKTMAPLMGESGKTRRGGSSIIAVSSILGLVGHAETVAYSASKGAVALMTKASAVEFATGGVPIRVNSIHPGFVRTAMTIGAAEQRVAEGEETALDDFVTYVTARTPMGRLAEPEEIAGAAAFLASEDASYMTGAQMVVDGGWTAW